MSRRILAPQMPEGAENLEVFFHKKALKEFERTEKAAQTAFRKKLIKLASRQEMPSPQNALHGFPQGYYKIKLKRAGLRLVYKYDGEKLTILVISVGKRERSVVYEVARARLEDRL